MMKFKLIPYVFVLLFLRMGAISADAQVNLYQKSLWEIRVGAGGTVFLGDLGGSKGRGKMGFFDFDLSSLRQNTSMGLTMNLTNKISIRGDLFQARVYGDDKLSGDPGRRNRNLSFRSDITEFSLTAEFVCFNLASLGRNKTNTSELYCFGGIGWIHFNPQANYKGIWYDLQPLGTEGQGLVNGKTPYSLNSRVIPFGIGYRKNIARNTYLGIAISMRKSNTDYIDDVSGTYANEDVLRENKGDVAAKLSNRSLTNSGTAGLYRGNPNRNDNYSFIQLTLAQGFGKTSAKQKARIIFLNSCSQKLKCPDFK